jgi:ribosomal protein S18 acetylase RimI-like enzyme
VAVRDATAADQARLVTHNEAMARESEDKGLDVAILERGVKYLLEHPAEGFYLIAEHGGRSAGSLMVTFEWSDWRAGRFWWIQSVYVMPEFRRRGVYRALHAEVRRRALDDPRACGIRLYVERDNGGAQATYQALGMNETAYRLYEEEFSAAFRNRR